MKDADIANCSTAVSAKGSDTATVFSRGQGCKISHFKVSAHGVSLSTQLTFVKWSELRMQFTSPWPAAALKALSLIHRPQQHTHTHTKLITLDATSTLSPG